MEIAHFYMLSLYTLVPIFIARVVCRGAWLQILQAYGIWIALLAFLGFLQGGLHGEGYGWMIIIAMFTTIIAIPLIVLLLRLRAHIRAGASVREQLPGAATGSPFAAIMQWVKKHWFGILAVAAFLLMLAAIGAPSAAEKEILRSQFHLPPDVALAEIAVDRNKRAPFPADIEGVGSVSV